jgi:hypothetical protein
MFKILISLVLGILGPWMMWRGKKTMNTKLIIWGAVLLVASYMVFSGSDDDKTTKAMLNTIAPQMQDQQIPLVTQQPNLN